MISLIVAVDKNWAIGNKGELLVVIPTDMKFFRETTTGNVVVMGRKTLEGFPEGKPLKNRVNIVVTKNKDYTLEDAIITHDLDSAMEEAKKYKDKEVFIIGGGAVYKQLLYLCETAYITCIDKAFEADTFFPNLDEDEEWLLEEESKQHSYSNMTFTFRKYTRKK